MFKKMNKQYYAHVLLHKGFLQINEPFSVISVDTGDDGRDINAHYEYTCDEPNVFVAGGIHGLPYHPGLAKAGTILKGFNNGSAVNVVTFSPVRPAPIPQPKTVLGGGFTGSFNTPYQYYVVYLPGGETAFIRALRASNLPLPAIGTLYKDLPALGYEYTTQAAANAS